MLASPPAPPFPAIPKGGVTACPAVSRDTEKGVSTGWGISASARAAVTAVTVVRRPAVTAHAGGIGGSVATVAEDQPTITTGGLSQRSAIQTIGAVADQKLVRVKRIDGVNERLIRWVVDEVLLGAVYRVIDVDPHTNAIADTISVDEDPEGIAYDPANGNFYVANEAGGGISVIDPDTNTVTGTIGSIVSAPSAIAYDPANGDLYITEIKSGVAVIDPNTDTVIDKFLGIGSTINEGIAVDPTNGDLYITGTGLGDVAVVNPDTNTIDYTIPVDDGPGGVGGDLEGIAYDPANGDLYATNLDGGATSGLGSVIVINPAG
ncbi:YncE family protein [Mycobacterium sp.]|uniref:YncE family protein n=1 Tax=Mycobacterium sp. TaxID=1785 RepID=UPI003D11BB72